MISGGGSFSRLGMHVGADWWTNLSAYEDHAPILDLDTGSVCVSVTIAGRAVGDAAVEFARELARQAARFAAEVERVHARQLRLAGDTGGGSGNGEAA
jgi:hypothetical protein